MNCNDCVDKNSERYAHEMAMAMAERTIKRLWVLCIILVTLLVGAVIWFRWYESQWEVVEEKTEVVQEADGNGNNHFIGGNFYDTTESYDNDTPQDP